MPSLTMTNQQPPNPKRMKHLFLVFLKQFQVNEYKLLMQFLQLIIDKYNLNPSKLFGFLTSQEDFILNELVNQPTLSQPSQPQPKPHTKTLQPGAVSQISSAKKVLANSSSLLRKNLRDNSARFAHNFNKRIQLKQTVAPKPIQPSIQLKAEPIEPPVVSNSIKTDQMMTMLKNRNDIIDSFVMKENQDQHINDTEADNVIDTEYDEYQDGEQQWETFNDASNLNANGSDNSNAAQYEESDSKSRIRKFSDKIRNELEHAFLANNFITGGQKKVLAKRLNLSERQVSKWFVHRREKLRRLEKRATNINTTLQQHYISRSQPQQYQSSRSLTDPPNDYFKEETTINNNGQLGEDQQEQEQEEDEENWFNGLQDQVEETCQYANHNETEYYDENEDYLDNTYHSSSETNNSDPEYQASGSTKRLSTSQLHASHTAKRVCMDSTELTGSKPSRRLFPPKVISHLERIFDSEKYLKDEQVHDIVRVTNLSEKQIRSWFKQRRYRFNQENKQNGIDIEIKKYNNLSEQTVKELEKAFRKNNYVYGNDKKVLAERLNLTPVQLERWFYYRRKKLFNGTF